MNGNPADRRLGVDDAIALATAALERAGASGPAAAATALALVDAECIGNSSHGLARLSGYAAHLRSGKVDGRAEPDFAWNGTALLRADLRGGLAYPGIHRGLVLAAERAPETGVVCLAVRNSHHGGALGLYLERLAESGLACLGFSGAPAAIPPWGGRRALFGTNPVAFAAPRAGGPPLVIDGAVAQVARGKLLVAAQRGEPVPEGWGFDAGGNPTTDPQRILDGGTMAAIGGAKGAAFALMVEVLCGALTGSGFGAEATPFDRPDAPPPRLGQIFFVIDPGRAAGAGFAGRVETLLAMVAEEEGARIPGANRAAMRAAARADGLALSARLLQTLRSLATD